MFGAAAMSLSSFCVVTNALRLNLVDVHNARRDRKRGKNALKMGKAREASRRESITLHIEGMMCLHCEATVKGCIEQFPEVNHAEVSHEKRTAEVYYTGELKSLEDMIKAIENEDYKVLKKDEG